MPWKRPLAYITGTVDEELLLRNEYLVTENKILRGQITGRLRLTDSERKTLGTIGKQLGRKAGRINILPREERGGPLKKPPDGPRLAG